MCRCFAILAFALLGPTLAARGQSGPDVSEKVRTAVKKHALDALSAYTKSEHARFVDFICPEVLKMLGGRDKLIDLLKSVDASMQVTGWSYGPAAVGEPGRFARMGKSLVTTIPYTVEYIGPGSRRKSESTLIGFSTDGGKSWKFAEGRKITRANVKDIFPNFPDSIELADDKGM